MQDIKFTGDDELIILRTAQDDRVYREFVYCFVDEAVCFPFGADDALPDRLPDDLKPVKCIMMDQPTRTALEQGPMSEVLRTFVAEGGFIFVPDPHMPVGGSLGYLTAMHNVQRVICCSGLTARHPAMLKRLRTRDESVWLSAWRSAAESELRQYEAMGHFFGDPVGFMTLRACDEAAAFFEDPSFLEPGDRYMHAHYASYGSGRGEHTGGRYLLGYAQRSGERSIADHVLNHAHRVRHWELDGVFLNLDITAPEGADPTRPPERILANTWTWPETAGMVGETWGSLSKATGDPKWMERAATHVTKAFQWLYHPGNGLIMHVGRPNGPDLRSAPWGRGISWYLCAVRGLLNDLPADHDARPELVRILSVILDGLLRYQDEYGLWRNVLDAAPQDSRPCASATSRFLQIYARAFHRGWLRDPRIPDMVERAWVGLTTKIWNTGLIAVCVGTSYSLSRQTYLARPHHTFRASRSEMLINWIERQRMLKV